MVLCAECRVSWDTEFGPLVKGYSATCGNDDSKPCFICCSARGVLFGVWGGVWGGGGGGGGPDSVFVLADLVCGSSGCGGRPVCGCVRGSCVWVCQRVLCAGVSEGPVCGYVKSVL